MEYKLLSDALTDEIRYEQSLNTELQEKVNEYESIIEYLYDELDRQKLDFESTMAYVDEFYAVELESGKPNAIAKHRVMNKGNKGAFDPQ